MTADQARMLYEKTLKQEQEFVQSFTGLLNANISVCFVFRACTETLLVVLLPAGFCQTDFMIF